MTLDDSWLGQEYQKRMQEQAARAARIREDCQLIDDYLWTKEVYDSEVACAWKRLQEELLNGD